VDAADSRQRHPDQLRRLEAGMGPLGYGYCDQAHLVDDFRDLAGSTPGEYLRLRAGSPNHVRLPTG
jgi:hypothetical protein